MKGVWPVAAMALTVVTGNGPASVTTGRHADAPIYVTLLFSRREITVADNCIPDDVNVARLDTELAPWLHARAIAGLKALRPGQWITLQAFIEVKDANPVYTSSPSRWDCRSANPALHWTNDVERYCYRDWKTIVEALIALPHVVFTDPLTVGIAFGRPATHPQAASFLPAASRFGAP